MESFHRALFTAIQGLIPCELCSCANASIQPARFLSVTTSSQHHGDISRKLLPAFNAHLHEHPLVPYFFSDKVVKTTDYASTGQFKATAIHNEYYRHLDVEMQICLSIPISREIVAIVALSRKGHDFSERDRLVLTLLRPHLINSLRSIEELGRLTLERDMLQKGAEARQKGFMLVHADGMVVSLSAFASEMVEKYFHTVLIEGDTLPGMLLQWFEGEVGLMLPLTSRSDVTTSVRVKREPLVVDKSGGCLTIALLQDVTCGDYILSIMESAHPVTVEKLGEYGLSCRETEVLLWLSKGKTNVEIAVILGMSKRTAEKHLEHIFAKLGVETRAAAGAIMRKRLSSC